MTREPRTDLFAFCRCQGTRNSKAAVASPGGLEGHSGVGRRARAVAIGSHCRGRRVIEAMDTTSVRDHRRTLTHIKPRLAHIQRTTGGFSVFSCKRSSAKSKPNRNCLAFHSWQSR